MNNVLIDDRRIKVWFSDCIQSYCMARRRCFCTNVRTLLTVKGSPFRPFEVVAYTPFTDQYGEKLAGLHDNFVIVNQHWKVKVLTRQQTSRP